MALLFENKVPGNRSAFSRKVMEVSDKLGTLPNWLMFLMDWEDGGTFSAANENTFGCTGFIQFCADAGQSGWKYEDRYKTIGGKRIKLSELKYMSNVEQMDWVYEYLKPYKGDIESYYDLYFAILCPEGLGKPDDYTLSQTCSKNNLVFDLNGNRSLTVGEVKQFLDKRVKDNVPAQYQADFKKKETFCRSIKMRSHSGEELRLAS
jgi:hypothetical protein